MLTIFGKLLNSATLAVADWQQRQRAFAELSSLDDRSLADIGLTRSEIPYVLSQPGVKLPAKTPAAANSNLQHAA